MRIGTVLVPAETSVTVSIDDLGIRIKCELIRGVTVKENDRVLVELLPGGLKGVIIGVM